MNARLDLLHQLWEMTEAIAEDPVASRHFDLNVYVESDAFRGVGDFRLGTVALQTPRGLFEHLAANAETENCGTVGCVMGFANICIPEVRKARLPLGAFSTTEIGQLLGIDGSSVRWLFLPQYYPGGWTTAPTPRQVANRIKAFINRQPARECEA